MCIRWHTFSSHVEIPDKHTLILHFITQTHTPYNSIYIYKQNKQSFKMKVTFALAVAILGAEVSAFPQFIPPKSNYALRPGTTNNNQDSNTNNKFVNAPNKHAAGTGIKFTPNQKSGTKADNVVPGFVPVKGGTVSRRSDDDDGDDDGSYDVPKGDQDDDSGDGVMFTTFTAPHTKVGTIKKEESAGDDDSAEERKFKAPSTKKQNGKKQKHTGDDDSPSKTDDHPKTSPSATKSKSEDKPKASGSSSPDDKKKAAKQAEKDAKQAEKDKKEAEKKKKKHSGNDDSPSKTDDHPKVTPSPSKKKSSDDSSTKKDDKKTSSKKKHSGDDDASTKTATDDKKSTSKSKNQAKTAAHKNHVSKHS